MSVNGEERNHHDVHANDETDGEGLVAIVEVTIKKNAGRKDSR